MRYKESVLARCLQLNQNRDVDTSTAQLDVWTAVDRSGVARSARSADGRLKRRILDVVAGSGMLDYFTACVLRGRRKIGLVMDWNRRPDLG